MEYHIYRDAKGEYRWYLQAANYKKIANSGEGYQNRADCVAAISLVKASSSAPVKDD
jgi:uncharacterized protein